MPLNWGGGEETTLEQPQLGHGADAHNLDFACGDCSEYHHMYCRHQYMSTVQLTCGLMLIKS